jgi:uncharacterized membrane protein YfcA
LLHYWFLFPIGSLIATLVMSAGVSGAALWVPVYFLWLGFNISIAFWLGLFTVLFGKGSGVYRNWRDGSYDGPLIRQYLILTIPAAVLGAFIQPCINEHVLVGVFGGFMLVEAVVIGLRAIRQSGAYDPHNSLAYPAAIIGGLLTGFISIGVGVLALPSVLRHRSVQRPGSAVGTITIIIFFTSLAAELGRLRPVFIEQLHALMPTLTMVLLWAIPGVVVGGQIGPRLAQKIRSERLARFYFCAVLMVVGAITFARAFG